MAFQSKGSKRSKNETIRRIMLTFVTGLGDRILEIHLKIERSDRDNADIARIRLIVAGITENQKKSSLSGKYVFRLNNIESLAVTRYTLPRICNS